MSNFIPKQNSSPFYRFYGWRIWALVAVFITYTLWYTGPGYFGQLAALPDYNVLQERGFYTGTEAVAALNSLTPDGRALKYTALVFDLPYMVMQALVFESFIAFGLRHIKPKSAKWPLLFILPIAFLLADFTEDSFVALTLATGSQALGTIAGVMTALKFITFIPAIFISLVMGIGGLWAWMRAQKPR